MDSKIPQKLEQAKLFALSMKMMDAYNILRRYYDRLPFQPEPEHAQYIGLFARVLAELGKENDLKFYLGELEKLREKTNNPAIAYQLAVVYAYSSEPRSESCKKILEEIILNPEAKPYHAKAKMMLADYYDRIHDDVGTCRRIIDSIGEVEDPDLAILVDIWRAKVLRDEKRCAEAEALLLKISSKIDPEKNWYPYFSCKVIQAILYIRQGELKKAAALTEEVRGLFKGRHFKSVAIQLEELERLIQKEAAPGRIKFIYGEPDSVLSYESKSLSLNPKSPSDRLIIQLVRRGFLDKAFIVKNVYSRDYDAGRDDKLIYYHIHSLRKRLKALGLPPETITSEGNGYRLVSEVESVEDEP